MFVQNVLEIDNSKSNLRRISLEQSILVIRAPIKSILLENIFPIREFDVQYGEILRFREILLVLAIPKFGIDPD